VNLFLVRIKKKKPQEGPRARINEEIRAKELRVLLEDGDNLGVIPREMAIDEAVKRGADLIEISPNAVPPVAKIMEYGKWQYLENKKTKEIRKKATSTETKNIQVKIGTGDHDLLIKSNKASEFLREGHRVKIGLYLKGRSKFMDKSFHEERLNRVLYLISEPYKISSGPLKGPKGIAIFIERDKAKKDEANPSADQKQASAERSTPI